MPSIKVKQGDSVDSIARAHGHFWETVWNHAENKELRARYDDPDVIRPDDEIFVPELRIKEESRPDAARHRFVLKGVPERLVIQVLEEGEPRANESYTLLIEGTVIEGETDGDGRLEHPIPSTARRGELKIGEGKQERTYPLRFGHVDPVTEVSGLQARLQNLGYDCDGISGEMTPRTEAALRAFQQDHGLEATGEPDDDTRSLLKDVHEC